jgi:hypothetical protein
VTASTPRAAAATRNPGQEEDKQQEGKVTIDPPISRFADEAETEQKNNQ